jgi:Tol biopolymer transport system component
MRIVHFALISFLSMGCTAAENKPKVTLDEFFNSVSFSSLELSPDGNSVVIGTERADWDQQIFRKDLWLYRSNDKALTQLTESGHDTDPKWSPDGRWIAFLSERKSPDDDSGSDDDDSGSDKDGVGQIYIISPSGGEAFAVTQGAEEVHAFSWSPDSKTLYYATRNPWSKAQKDEYREQWKDVVQYRTAERGDTIFALDLSTAASNHTSALLKKRTKAERQSDVTPGARAIATSPWRVSELLTSPDGTRVALMTNPVNKREEKFDDYEIYAITVDGATAARSAGSDETTPAQRITHNKAVEKDLQWANDSRHIFFTIEVGDVSGPYRDLQPHLYSVDVMSGAVEQWGKDFAGPVNQYGVAAHDILASARIGTEVQMYSASMAAQPLRSVGDWQGTYDLVSVGPAGRSLSG